MLMIPDSDFASHTEDWKQALSQSIRSAKELYEYCELDHQHLACASDQDFPLRVTRYYASLIEKGNLNDPLLRQVMIDDRESIESPGYSNDAVGDLAAMSIPGLIHKYHGRVLLNLTSACAIHCRYCFRRHFPYTESRMDLTPSGPVFEYLRLHTEISEVILSGGDPLMLSDEKLLNLVELLNTIPHVHTLRIHSRLISVLPERINDGLIKTLQSFAGQVVCVTHINHANEIEVRNQAAVKALAQQGIQLFNQSVLLKGINDDVEVLKSLSHKLFSSAVIPYYLHRLDKVQGAAHFDIPHQQSCQLYQQLQQQLPGYLLPRMVDEIAGQLSKSAVHCDKYELLSREHKKL